jgi:hypothetical protein
LRAVSKSKACTSPDCAGTSFGGVGRFAITLKSLTAAYVKNVHLEIKVQHQRIKAVININFIARFSARFWASSVAGWKLYLTLLRRFCRAATLASKSSLPALARRISSRIKPPGLRTG